MVKLHLAKDTGLVIELVGGAVVIARKHDEVEVSLLKPKSLPCHIIRGLKVNNQTTRDRARPPHPRDDER